MRGRGRLGSVGLVWIPDNERRYGSSTLLDMTEKDYFDRFWNCLRKAGSKMDSHYFQLPVARRKERIYRERVYCYELYHQLRNALGDNFAYKLHGEVDKAGHPIIHRNNVQVPIRKSKFCRLLCLKPKRNYRG